MDLLLFKVALTPLFIAGLTLAGRRYGPALSGALAGLPLTSGPISVFLALQEGTEFASRAAAGTLVGLIAVAAFCVAYFGAAQRMRWPAALSSAVAAFALSALALEFVSGSVLFMFACVVFLIVVALIATKRTIGEKIQPPRPRSSSDLLLRVVLATGLVLLLTSVAENLGPHLTGLISPFPIFGALLTVFAQRQSGVIAAEQVLRGLLVGSLAFAAFFLVVGELLTHCSLLLTYSLAAFCALSLNGAMFALLRRDL